MRGRRAFGEGLRGLLASHRVDSTGNIQEIAVAGDLAYCWTVLSVRVTPRSGAAAVLRTGSALSIFGKQSDGKWRLVRDANMLSVA
jgi:ketosteroid isomerase-like protein